MACIKSIAKSKVDERKITHPNIVKIKVINTDGIFPKPENNFKRNNLSNIKNKPWYAPQRIKVHSAPCQKPETKKPVTKKVEVEKKPEIKVESSKEMQIFRTNVTGKNIEDVMGGMFNKNSEDEEDEDDEYEEDDEDDDEEDDDEEEDEYEEDEDEEDEDEENEDEDEEDEDDDEEDDEEDDEDDEEELLEEED